MGMFKSEKPRAYSHQYIYVNERKEKLNKIEENAKRDLGILPPQESTAEERIRGKFVESICISGLECKILLLHPFSFELQC